jgi:uncharacterized protein YuzE
LSVRIGAWKFDYVDYDAEADVLYLSMGPPREGYGEETPEGHFLRYDEAGNFYGVTLLDARQLDSRDELFVTVPHREPVELPETGEFELVPAGC